LRGKPDRSWASYTGQLNLLSTHGEPWVEALTSVVGGGPRGLPMSIRREAICGVFLFEACSKSSVRCTVQDGAKTHSQ
jgi:hypothetical protein